MKKGKKALLYLLMAVLALLAVGVYYYITLPAVNIHASGFWFFILALVAFAAALYAARRARKEYKLYFVTGGLPV